MPTPGETICGELHLQHLAPSSMGAQVFEPVFVARNAERDEQLLLAVVEQAFVPDAAAMSTFMAGANVLPSVRHPALVRVVLVDREEDYCVVGYEELPGAQPLSDLIVAGGSRRLLARAAIEVARGLAYLHRRGLHHGALTPGTVVLWEGVPLLWEYGLAELCNAEAFAPRTRRIGGDVVAPEIPNGGRLTAASDVYAWGAVMASIASGELGSAAVSAVLEGDVEPQQQGPLLDVIVSALRPEPGDRPRDGVHLLELLQQSFAGVDPAVGSASSAAAAAADDGLQRLAQQYLEEMSKIEQRTPASSASAAPVSVDDANSGALGRVQLVKRGTSGAQRKSKNRPWLSGSNRTPPPGAVSPPPPPPPPAAAIDSPGPPPVPEPAAPSVPPRGESTAPTPLPPPPTSPALDAATASNEEPEWEGRYKLPSGTYAAIRDAPQPDGDGSVRGPAPGVSGVDAGVLGSAAAVPDPASPGVRRGAGPNAVGWLRPAPPKAEDKPVDSLFELSKWTRDRPHGIRKRWVLLGEGPPMEVPDTGFMPPGAAASVEPTVDDADLTPPEGIAIVDPPRVTPRDVPLSERETPPSVELAPGAAPPSERPVADEVEPGLPPMPSSDVVAVAKPRKKAPAKSEPKTEPEPEPKAPASAAKFRAPRMPGPHGPSPVPMALVIGVLAGALALGATLSASATLGGLDRLWSSPSAATPDDQGDAPPAVGLSDTPEVAAGPCPNGMELIGSEAGFCIDRAEYPGIDRVPAADVDLASARKACDVRGHALCTEEQWAQACRGEHDWRYPYGPRHDAQRCRVGDPQGGPQASGTDVQCVSPQGVFDLVGNVAEWTAQGSVMGGSIRSKVTASCATRQRLAPKATRPVVGFRCCTERLAAEVTSP